MALVITAPNEDYSVLSLIENAKLFLAGGITNCPDWQSELIENFQDVEKLTIYNPRRKNFPIDDPSASEKQICWEYKQLKDADIICFWFSRGSLNPIVLYELGRWGNSSDKPIIIGIDPKYERKNDVIIQTKLSRPKVKIAEDFSDFCVKVKWLINIHLEIK